MKAVLSILITLCLLSCSDVRQHRKLLDQAQSIIEHKADSAYSLLSSLKFEDIKGEENRALYALLYTKTQDKRQIDIKSDSLISIALEYYQNHGSRFHKASAYFYSARVDWWNNDIPEAVRKLTYAEEIVHPDSLYLRGLIYNAIGLCYGSQLNHLKAIENYEKSYDIFYQLDTPSNCANDLYSIARQYQLLKKYNKAIDACQKSKDIYSKICDTANMLRCDIAITKYSLHQTNNYSEAKNRFYESREQYKNYPQTMEEYELLADIYRYNKRDSSAYYQEKVLAMCDTTTLKEKSAYFVRYAYIAETTENYKAAYWRLRRANRHLINYYRDNLNNEVADLNQKYKGELHKSRAERLKVERDKILAFCIILLCSGAFIIFILIQRHKTQLRKADEDLGAAQDLAQAIANTQAVMNISPNDSFDSERLDNINYMMSRFNTLIEKMPTYELKPRKFVDEFISIMRSQSQADDAKTIFYEIINRTYPDVLTTIGSKYNLTSSEIEVMCMSALGISNNAIRILMDHTNYKTVYNIRGSIKLKLNITLDNKSVSEWLKTQKEQLTLN